MKILTFTENYIPEELKFIMVDFIFLIMSKDNFNLL